MLAVSRMKSLISLCLPAFIPNLHRPTSPSALFFEPTSQRAISCFSRALLNPNLIPSVMPRTISWPNCLGHSLPHGAMSLNTEAAPSSSGEIHVIVGPMFAGKTTTLLRRINSESSNGRSVAIIKSNKDTRYGLESITTHDGEKLPCFPLDNLSYFQEMYGFEAYEKLEVIGIDEAQFFEDLYDFCSKAADHDGKTLIIAGLDGDYLRRGFGSVLDIIPIADSVTKLSARCELCGKHAFFTLRKTEETETELIAGADVYMPVCRKHYVSGQGVKEAARTILESQKIHCGSSI